MIQIFKTVAEYDEFTQQNRVAIVHFGFDWNSFDRGMQRALLELKAEFGEKISLGFVDIDNNGTIELLHRVNLVNSPTLVYFRDGEQVGIKVGMRPTEDIRQHIQSLLQFEEF